MKNTFGSDLSLTIFGESHGRAIGAVLDGMAAGLPVDEAFLAACMDKRRARGDGLSTPRVEADAVQLLSGVVNAEKRKKLEASLRLCADDVLAMGYQFGIVCDLGICTPLSRRIIAFPFPTAFAQNRRHRHAVPEGASPHVDASFFLCPFGFRHLSLPGGTRRARLPVRQGSC